MTDQPTNCITLNSPPTEEILRLDKEGFHYKGEFIADAGEAHRLMVEFLNQNTPQPEPEPPTDEELLELMPETMRDEFSYAAKVCSDAMGGQVKLGIFRVALNTAALEYARAVLPHFSEVFAETERE